MSIAFLIVFILLAKFGFPVIVKALDERKEHINSSLEAAARAQQKVENLQAEMDGIRADAERQKAEILRSAAETREKIISEARARAEEQGERIIAAAKANAETEREAILRDARHQVALLSIALRLSSALLESFFLTRSFRPSRTIASSSSAWDAKESMRGSSPSMRPRRMRL